MIEVLGGAATRERDSTRPIAPLERTALVIASAKVAFFVAIGGVWGIHRDEFYYLAGGRRLGWGYVDHPPLTPLLYRVGDLLFGDSQLALHAVPAILSGVLVVLAVAIARELRGGRAAQVLTAIGVAVSPMFLTTSHFLSTVTVDSLLWTAGLLLVTRLLRTGDARLWIAIGVVAGIGLLNKDTMLFWGVGVVGGVLLSARRDLLASRFVAIGALIAFALSVPYLLWQIDNGWPTIEFLRSLQDHNDEISNPLLYFPFQLVLPGPVLAFVWIPGFRWLLRDPEARRHRPLALGYLLVLVVIFLLRGKAYYVGSWYPALIAAGAVRLELVRPASLKRYAIALLATAPFTALFAIPLVPSTSSAAPTVVDANAELGEMLGWDNFTHQVAAVAHALPPADQARLTILTSNYSEAGALEYDKTALGLPQPISRQNSYWLWGYGDARQDGTVLAVGFEPRELEPFFGEIDVAGHVTNAAGIHNKEFGAPILICRNQRVSWSELWPKLKRFE